VKKDIKILVADDHPMLLKGLLHEFQENGYHTLLEAANGAVALEALQNEKPDIAVLDIEMPLLNGLNTRFIILTSHKEKAFIIKANQLNIDGYLLKDEPFSEMDNCIQSLLRGETYFSKTFESIFSEHVAPELAKINFLSPSERTILRLVAQNKSSKEIGDIINISHRTVQKHRTNIIAKLDLDTAPDALLLWAKANKELISVI
jgi:two-component system nitrate/nitrite response regulator NarL